MANFKIQKNSKKSKARYGVYSTRHGSLKTPFFMPVATQGTVKQLSAVDMRKLNSQILLSNTYHLMLRPGEKLVKSFGGLHKFMDWDGPILTDSGGFQVFSLAGNKSKSGKSLVKMTRDGVYFKSFIDGREYYLTPEKSLEIQTALGVDIAVALDECVALPAKDNYIEKSVELTAHWAKKTLVRREKMLKRKGNYPNVHCVIQGGLNKKLRLKSLSDLESISAEFKYGWDGYNIGGLSVGESTEEMYQVLDYLTPAMPENKPRYLMGVGYPDNIVQGVRRGVDMFDCVIPTREGRHGRLFVRNQKISLNRKNFYKSINIVNAKFSKSKAKINSDSKIEELRNLSFGYLHHLFKIKEPLGARLASLHNLEFYIDLMKEIRGEIRNGSL